jgi:hypothetical protein
LAKQPRHARAPKTGSIAQHVRWCLHRIEGKHYAHLFVCGGNNDNFALIAPPFCSRDFYVRSNWRRSPLSLACGAHWATKLFPYARCRRGAQCSGAVLLVTSRLLPRRYPLSWILLALRILRSILWILPTVGLVRHRTSLGLVTGADIQICEWGRSCGAELLTGLCSLLMLLGAC